MTDTGLKQRLAAILAADAAGYSRLMAADERATVASLDAARAVFRSNIESRQGRVIDMAGDSVLAVFETAAGAVSAALAVQQNLNASGNSMPEDRRMRFRIGVHMGDLIEKRDGTVYGDGVNIAARLQALAEPGGLWISDAVNGAVRGKVAANFVDQGEQQVKNIPHAIRAFAVRADGNAAARPLAAAGTIDLSLPDKPSIAVLPFANLSGDPEQEYFTDGVTEDIITELSRFHLLFVIARNSTFTYKGKPVDVRTVAKELGVRYVLEGSIRKAANRIRVTAQLIDALSGNHIWAEKYDRVLEDIFAVQEEVTRSIVAAIAPEINAAELAKVRRPRPGSMSAYEMAMRANANAVAAYQRHDVVLLDQSIREAREALAVDPGSVLARTTIARAQWHHCFYRTTPDMDRARKEGLEAADQAIELDRSDHYGYAFRGLLLGLTGTQWEEALSDCRRAYELNPNDAVALSVLGWAETGYGNPREAIEYLLRVVRTNPRDPWAYNVQNLLSYAFFLAGDYAKGLDWAQRSLNAAPNLPAAHQNLVLCYVGLGEIGKAKSALEELRRLAPEFVDVRLNGFTVLRREQDRRRYTTFLRIGAGLEDPGAAEALR